MAYEKDIKSVRLLQDRAVEIEKEHDKIFDDLEDIKSTLVDFDLSGMEQETDFIKSKEIYLEEMSVSHDLDHTDIEIIYAAAESRYEDSTVSDILSEEDKAETNRRIEAHITDFNKRYGLDGWDYAIALGCGTFAAMLDLFCVKAPPKPTVDFTQKVDGVFNRWVQDGFNRLIPQDLSKKLSLENTIGGADTSTMRFLIDAPDKVINPFNHRLRELSHDPILGFFFGIRDMMNGTCTVIHEGSIITMNTTAAPVTGNIQDLVLRMFKHLVSDVNAMTSSGNRGMGLPAPFMGLLRMFNFPVGDSTFDKQIEFMYVNGYDFRQFVATSIPLAIMEILMRVFYVAKQMKVNSASFGESILDTMPLKLNPRFRLMLAMAYGTVAGINAGKVYVTHNIMNANYGAWMGFAWNTFHALKWALFQREWKLWNSIEKKELELIASYVDKIDALEARVATLPI